MIVRVPGHLDVQDLTVIFVVLILLFGGKSPRQIVIELTGAMQREPRLAQAIFTVVVTIPPLIMLLVLALSWLSTQN